MAAVSVPLPQGIKGFSAFPKLQERLVNTFWCDGKILDTPGIDKVSDGFGVGRASFVFKDQLYMVMGTKLQRVDETGATTDIGDVPGSGQLSVDTNFTHAVIVGAGTGADGYFFDGTTLTQLTDDEFVGTGYNHTGAVSVAQMDGHWLYVPDDGGPLFFSDVLAPNTIPANQFFDPEVFPDRNRAIIVVRQTLYALGTNSIELFRNIGSIPAPFVRVNGGAIPVGYVSGLKRVGDTFAFIGRDQDQGYKIYIAGQGEAIPISNEAIDEILNQDYTEAELLTARSERYQWLGKDILTFHLPRVSLSFHSGEWFYQQSGVTGPTESLPWRARNIIHAYGEFWCSDTVDGRIGKLSETDTEYTNEIQRTIETFIRSEEPDSHFDLKSLDLHAQSTTGGEGRVGLSLSRDGVLYSPFFWRSCAPAGHYEDRLTFQGPGGLGDYPNFCGVLIQTTDNARLTSDVMVADL